MKTCTKCKESKELVDFPRLGASKDGLHRWCRDCKQAYDRIASDNYRKNNPESRSASQARYNRSASKLGSNRKWRFGLTPEAVEARIAEQGGVCGLCTRDFSKGETFVDHDHACCPGRTQKTCGNCVRAILCRACNQGLGLLQDDPELLQKAIEYILKYRK